jgi:hypothetical protein
MGLFSNLDPILVSIVCALLCAGLLVVGFVLQAVGNVFGVLFGIFEVFVDILQGGPVAWCGCLVTILGCIGFAGFVLLMMNAPASCAEYPTNFCRWFGLG